MPCVYFCYKKYCKKQYAVDNAKYGYADLTDYECKFKDCQEKCGNYITKINNSGKPNNLQKHFDLIKSKV